MIRIEFDREKCSTREAQLIDALVVVAMVSPHAMLLVLEPSRAAECERSAAQFVIKTLGPKFPDLNLRIVEEPGARDA